MKYINADKLIAGIKHLQDKFPVITYEALFHLITSLQQEQPESIETGTTYDTYQYTPKPSVGIEDVARVQFASHAKVFDKKRKAVFDWEQFKEVAGIFYGLGLNARK